MSTLSGSLGDGHARGVSIVAPSRSQVSTVRVIRQITHLATDNILPVCDGASNEGLGLCLSCARVSAV